MLDNKFRTKKQLIFVNLVICFVLTSCSSDGIVSGTPTESKTPENTRLDVKETCLALEFASSNYLSDLMATDNPHSGLPTELEVAENYEAADMRMAERLAKVAETADLSLADNLLLLSGLLSSKVKTLKANDGMYPFEYEEATKSISDKCREENVVIHSWM